MERPSCGSCTARLPSKRLISMPTYPDGAASFLPPKRSVRSCEMRRRRINGGIFSTHNLIGTDSWGEETSVIHFTRQLKPLCKMSWNVPFEGVRTGSLAMDVALPNIARSRSTTPSMTGRRQIGTYRRESNMGTVGTYQHPYEWT